MTEKKKTRDDQFFDCSNKEEHIYVSNLYGNRKTVVAAFLKDKCRSSVIEFSTHLDVYELIELKLGYPIPVKRLKG